MGEAIPLPTMDAIQAQVVTLRGCRVILASTLAGLYEVETRALNQAVQRNLNRFPADFMFQLTWDEVDALKAQNAISRSQTVILKRGQNAKYAPYAFTEQGVAMLSSVLKSERAVAVNIEIMRTFVKLRSMLTEHVDLKRRLRQLEQKYDENFRMVFDAIHQLMDEPVPGGYRRTRIGFTKEK